MNVQALGVTSVTPTLCAPTLRDLMSVVVWKVLREMVKPAQVKYDDSVLYPRNVRLLHTELSFGHKVIFLLQFLFFSLSSATAELFCDPPCTGNKVCQNYSGDPQCVCADGFTGEDICIGILDYFSTYLNNYFLLNSFPSSLSPYLKPNVMSTPTS